MTADRPRIGLVLGGGGLKGFAHIGVLDVLQRAGIDPVLMAGSSIGSLIASAYALGTPVATMRDRALSLRRKDLFRVNATGFARGLLRSPSFYTAEPLHNLIAAVIPDRRFDQLSQPLLVNTVDLERGMQVVWGAPGFRTASIREAVYASCALPGFFPPGTVAGRVCVDGGTVDNMPVTAAAEGLDLVIAVDVGNSEVEHATDVTSEGIASIFMRSATLMMRMLQRSPLVSWEGPPLLLIRPHVSRYGWFNFDKIPTLISAGAQAAEEVLPSIPLALQAGSGIFPRQRVRLHVSRDQCTACGQCIAMAPYAMVRGIDGKAVPRQSEFNWSPVDSDFTAHCPTGAIKMGRSLIPTPQQQAALPAAGTG
ncbi:MAG: patatin-like phospholipase family protein [Gemmatimonadota bacterium]